MRDRDELHERRRAWSRRRRRRRWVAVGAVAAVVLLAGGVLTVLAVRPASPTRSSAHAASTPTPPRTTAAPPPAPEPSPHEGIDDLRLPARLPAESLVVPVLMFHRVAPAETATNAVSADLTVTPERFAAEMAWLGRHGYQPVGEARLFAAMVGQGRLPRKPVVLTFDDGYVDAVDAVLPVLERRGWPATFFVITGRVGQPAFLTWPQIERLDAAGMDIGSHTVDHVELPGLGAAGRRAQLVDSRRALERHLGHRVWWFCYPAGRHDDASAEAVAKAGYLLAYTTEPGSEIAPASRTALPRVRISGGMSVDGFAEAVEAASAQSS